MADMPVSDLARAKQHEPNQEWPETVKVQLYWWVDGRPRIRTILISADEFFGLGEYGAPIDGSSLIGRIENMRRAGPPPAPAQNIQPPREKKIGKKKR